MPPRAAESLETRPTGLAEEKGVSVSQLAIAWILAQRPEVVPIPGTRRAERVEENVGAADVELTEADLRRIHDVLPDGAYGSRYAEDDVPVWK